MLGVEQRASAIHRLKVNFIRRRCQKNKKLGAESGSKYGDWSAFGKDGVAFYLNLCFMLFI
jgi:hypothetical protein